MMKRLFLFFFGIILFITGCTSNRIIVNDSYNILLYENSLSGHDDTNTERVTERFLDSKDVESKAIGQKRVETFFGKEIEFTYTEASAYMTRKGDRLFSRGKIDGKLTHYAAWNADTKKLETYSYIYAGEDRSFKSEVNEFSTEEEFVSYAKSILSPYVSVEGRKVEIATRIFEYDEDAKNYHYRRGVDGFENNVHKVEDFYAEYWFTFYKEINGIRRYDTITISINNTGEVHFIDNYEQENLYKPFLDVKVDMEQAERITHEALDVFIPGRDCVEFVPSLVATTDGELWLLMEVYVSYGEGTSGYTYAIKVAEIEK